MYIRAHCYVYDQEDCRGASWPELFLVLPMIGHRVESLDRKHQRKVSMIVHAIHPDTKNPIIRIELCK